MRTLAVCSIATALFVSASESAVFAQSTCDRGDPDPFCPNGNGDYIAAYKGKKKLSKKEQKKMQAYIIPYGFDSWQGIYLEGAGLEGRRFTVSSPAGKKPYPPEAGWVLTDEAGCSKGSAPLTLTILQCESGTTARGCQVTAKGPQNGTICGLGGGKTVGVAIVQGYWDASGAWQLQDNGTDVVTVACLADASQMEKQSGASDGAITRCVRDYRFEPKGNNEALTACIRMQRADYCADGKSHTFGGTNIDVHTPEDPVERSVQITGSGDSFDDCTDGRCFEATWDKDGAICVAHTRWKGTNDFMNAGCVDTKFPDRFPDSKTGPVYCRSGRTPSASDYFTRSKVHECGQLTQDCSGPPPTNPDKFCPGCTSTTAKKQTPAKQAPKAKP
ncbi:MAG TPA: ADYC domain-containing protein [Polyangia bacterium]|nr:ADYC domain-containing protein [Polyangia bacterium]